MMYPEGEIIAEGREAWQRLRQRARKSWQDWSAVGHALLVLRKDALLEAKTDRPFGKIYTRIMAASLREHGLDDIGQQVRWRLMQCLRHESDITLWLSSLSEQRQLKLCHPDTIWMRFSEEYAPGRAVQRRTVTANRDHRGRLPPNPDQDTIRRIAAELRENWTTDVYRLALIAYHAVMRPAPPPPKQARRTAPSAELEVTA
jgi:hypothetical protein